MSPTQAQDPLTLSTLQAIQDFNAALNRHDLQAMMALMTGDCVFENTYPPPDGERFSGQAAVRAFWKEFFENSSGAHFDFEEVFASGERAFVRWRYTWQSGDASGGYVRGVDVFRVRKGKVAEKLSYVKG